VTPTEDKEAKLSQIADQVRDLRKSPLYEYRRENGYRPVVGEGDPDARILFVGEAPGAEEAKAGRPFVGPAGDVLDELLRSVGLDREEVYITSVLKDRPPGNRDPRAEEIRVYRPFLSRQIAIIQPEVIATLGRFALQVILDELGMSQRGQGLGELHGKALEAQAEYGALVVVPLYHPAAVFYNPDLQDTLQEDFHSLSELK
jgi:uracil-DNA glycosylase family 4